MDMSKQTALLAGGIEKIGAVLSAKPPITRRGRQLPPCFSNPLTKQLECDNFLTGV
ncbi:MAG: hypothetical protein WCO10_01310 [bacterium]